MAKGVPESESRIPVVNSKRVHAPRRNSAPVGGSKGRDALSGSDVELDAGCARTPLPSGVPKSEAWEAW